MAEKDIRPLAALSSDPTSGEKTMLRGSCAYNPSVWVSKRETVILKVAQVAQTKGPQWLFALGLFTYLSF